MREVNPQSGLRRPRRHRGGYRTPRPALRFFAVAFGARFTVLLDFLFDFLTEVFFAALRLVFFAVFVAVFFAAFFEAFFAGFFATFLTVVRGFPAARFLAARFLRRGMGAAIGGTNIGSDTKPSAPSGSGIATTSLSLSG